MKCIPSDSWKKIPYSYLRDPAWLILRCCRKFVPIDLLVAYAARLLLLTIDVFVERIKVIATLEFHKVNIDRLFYTNNIIIKNFTISLAFALKIKMKGFDS